MHIPSLNAWDQFVWLLGAAMLQATTKVEQYCYRHGHAVDLGPVMPVTQLRVTDKEGTYLCVAQALVFGGSVLAYYPARDKAEWVPARGITNHLSWVEERSAVALANFVPHIPQEAAHIARLGTHHLVSWPDDSSLEEEGDGQAEEGEDGQVEEEDDDDGQAEEEEGKWEKEDPADVEEQGKTNPELLSGSMELEQGEME